LISNNQKLELFLS